MRGARRRPRHRARRAPFATVPPGAGLVLARLGGDDPRQAVRRALREAKCLIETGEVLRPTSRRRAAGPGGPLRDRRPARGGMAVKALCWEGVNKLAVEQVPDPQILNDQDAIVQGRADARRAARTCTCINGYIPTMRAGDVHRPRVHGRDRRGRPRGPPPQGRRPGRGVLVHRLRPLLVLHARPVVAVRQHQHQPGAGTEALGFDDPAAVYGYSHAMGGFRGSHAEYVRVPFADYGAFPVPDGVADTDALFASDAAPTGWMGAAPGRGRARRRRRGVGRRRRRPDGGPRRACCSAPNGSSSSTGSPTGSPWPSGTSGAETIDYTQHRRGAELRERTGGRGPDVCIEAVGMEAHSTGPRQYVYDQVKQQLRLQTDRPIAVREADHACRKGGSVFVLGVFAGMVDKFPLGAMMNKGLTLRGAQQHGQRYIPMLLDRMATGELPTRHLATHAMPLDEARGLRMFKNKKDGCVRAVFRP